MHLFFFYFSMWQIDENYRPHYSEDIWNPIWSLDDGSIGIREK